MSNNDLIDAIIAVEAGEASAMQTLETFGLIIRNGMTGALQGSWQRAIAHAVESGLIDPETGNLTDFALDALGDLEDEG